jgi:hypothetical protein
MWAVYQKQSLRQIMETTHHGAPSAKVTIELDMVEAAEAATVTGRGPNEP